MGWFEGLILGLVLSALALWLGIFRLVPTRAGRRQLVALLLTRFRPSAPQLPPAPEPERDPEPLVGNVKRVPEEMDVPPDETARYQFPPMQAPKTRFEDFNRRLIVFTLGTSSLKSDRLPPRNYDDYPLRITCALTDLERAIKTQLRCTYPVIIDRNGQFAAASRTLELYPGYETPLITRYLNMKEHDRPVVISYAKEPPDWKTQMLELRRYGFQPALVPLSYLSPYIDDNLDFVFRELTGPSEDWMWFSLARMRLHSHNLNKPIEESKAVIAKFVNRNRFARLWELREDFEALPPSDQTSETEDSPPVPDAVSIQEDKQSERGGQP
jgi:hypothetical protein